MTHDIAFLPDALEDIADAHAHYQAIDAELVESALAPSFVADLTAFFARIRTNPQIYTVWRKNIRAARLSKFPYVVYYRSREKDVLVVAVQHGRRSFKTWSGRLT